MTRLAALALLLALPLSSLSGQEREEILSYDVRVELRDGGVMRVTEDIEVRVLGRSIRRGIYRDFPTRFPTEDGWNEVRAPFDVLEVRRNGRPEPWVTEGIGGPGDRAGVRVRIGDADVLLDHRVHRYRIVYETSRWMRFDDERARLDWNVTGNGWDFPILSATAAVELPREPPDGGLELEAWTGPVGATFQNATWAWADGAARFATTEPLGRHHGLTVRLDLPAGVVAPPDDALRRAWFMLDWGGLIEGGVLVCLVLLGYALVWARVGDDPPGGTVVVRYEPPAGFSPAALGYLRRKGFHRSQLVAALVSLAVQGVVSIHQRAKTWRIEKEGALPDDAAPEERGLYGDILGRSESLVLTDGPSERLREGVANLGTSLHSQLQKVYFSNNRPWFVLGLLVSLAGLGVVAARTEVTLQVVATGVALAAVNVVFFNLLERVTVKGRKVLDELEGFRLFLGATEEDRFDRLQAPEKSLELFERYLPHAIALGVENEWAGRFESILAAAAAGAGAGGAARAGTLHWYSGTGDTAGLGGMTSALGSSFSSSLSSASAPPSSGGSGGGGGGFSGGGGGGGGGGGW